MFKFKATKHNFQIYTHDKARGIKLTEQGFIIGGGVEVTISICTPVLCITNLNFDYHLSFHLLVLSKSSFSFHLVFGFCAHKVVPFES